jgi:uncharacterized membrane protein YfcA
MKTLSVYWALPVGLVSVIWQAASYYLRFGELNPHAAWTDYLVFFAAGTLGGWILVRFFNRLGSDKTRWAVLIASCWRSPLRCSSCGSARSSGGLF